MTAPGACPPMATQRQWVHNVMFGNETWANKLFDEVLITARSSPPTSAIGNSEPPFGHGLC